MPINHVFGAVDDCWRCIYCESLTTEGPCVVMPYEEGESS